MDEKFPDRIDSKFRYVLLASTRAEQLMRGARPTIEVATAKKTSVAMREVTDDRVDWGYGPAPTLEEEMPALEMTASEESQDEEEEVH